MSTWRKLLWLITRTAAIIILYTFFAVGILWYNEPETIERIGAGHEPVWTLAILLGSHLELVGILLILLPAVIAGVLLPHKPAWQH